MRRTIALMVVAVIASGCVAMQHTPSATVISGLRAIAIVAIEAPPLLLHPKGDTDRAAIAALGLASPGERPNLPPWPAGHEYAFLALVPLLGPPLAMAVATSPAVSSIPRGEIDRGVMAPDPQGELLRAAVGFTTLFMPSYDRSLWALRTWLDSWSGIGRIAVGMARQGFDLQLTRYDERGWRAPFYTTRVEHPPSSATGTGWEPTP